MLQLGTAGCARESWNKMIAWRLAVPAIVVAAALAGCFTYFVPPLRLVTVPGQLPEKSRSCARAFRLTLTAQEQRKEQTISCMPLRPS
jgi:hypothetical protein